MKVFFPEDTDAVMNSEAFTEIVASVSCTVVCFACKFPGWHSELKCISVAPSPLLLHWDMGLCKNLDSQ